MAGFSPQNGMLVFPKVEERKNFEKEYIALRREEIEYDYYKFQE